MESSPPISYFMICLSVNHGGYCEVIKDDLKYTESASFLELYGSIGFLLCLLRILLDCWVCPNAIVLGLRLEL